jgi:hypothetical protein
MAMIRKQLYLDAAHEEKLKHLAQAWGVSEAEVVRRAIDGLMEYEYDSKGATNTQRVAEAATVAYGMTMERTEARRNRDWQNRRLDHDAWLEELAFIEERARKLAAAGGGSTYKFNREDAYDKRRMRLPY